MTDGISYKICGADFCSSSSFPSCNDFRRNTGFCMLYQIVTLHPPYKTILALFLIIFKVHICQNLHPAMIKALPSYLFRTELENYFGLDFFFFLGCILSNICQFQVCRIRPILIGSWGGSTCDPQSTDESHKVLVHHTSFSCCLRHLLAFGQRLGGKLWDGPFHLLLLLLAIFFF